MQGLSPFPAFAYLFYPLNWGAGVGLTPSFLLKIKTAKPSHGVKNNSCELPWRCAVQAGSARAVG